MEKDLKTKRMKDLCKKRASSNHGLFILKDCSSIGTNLIQIKGNIFQGLTLKRSTTSALFNSKGDELIPLQTTGKDFEVVYSNGSDIIVEFFSIQDGKRIPVELKHFSYSKKNNSLSEINEFHFSKFERYEPYHIHGEGIDPCISISCSMEGKPKKQKLYSIRKKEVITPAVDLIYPPKNTDNGLIFTFEDTVESTETINGQKKSDKIIGAVNSDGVMYDGVYDTYFNREIHHNLDNDPKFHKYKALAGYISELLDEEIEKEYKKRNSGKILGKVFEENIRNNGFKRKDN